MGAALAMAALLTVDIVTAAAAPVWSPTVPQVSADPSVTTSPDPTSTPSTSPTLPPASSSPTPTTPSAEETRTGSPDPLPPLPPGLDDATRRALELEGLIEDLRGEQAALEERVGATSHRMSSQLAEVDSARRRLEDARAVLQRRLVQVYKDGAFDPLVLLLGSRTFEDFVARLSLVSHVAAHDDKLITEASLRAAEAEYGRYVLADVQVQDQRLRGVLEERMHSLRKASAEQNAIIARLSEPSRALVRARSGLGRMSRAQWRAASIPLGTVIRRVEATVEPYPELAYLVSEGQPTRYRSTGRRFSAVSSWYGPGFNGRPTASGQVFNQDDFTCASRTLPFGTRLALSLGTRRIIVVVNDRGPYVPGRDLDLSAAAAQALGFSGVATLEAETVVPLR